MKRLLLTCTDLMAIQFMVPHMRYLSENGFDVELACSVVGNRLEDLQKAVGDIVKIHTVRLVRSPYSLKNLSGYSDLKKLLEKNRYDVIWTNEPVMGVMTRLAARKARKNGTKVVYMCHGFHFYKGASKLSWLTFYPIERIMAHYCDVIVVINREDEAIANTFKVPKVEYIHGIGVNTERLHKYNDQCDIRKELNLSPDDFIVLSVGELNQNKNHQVIIRAVAKLADPAVHYVICGKGELMDELRQLSESLGVANSVHLLGYRNDVVDICSQVDLFAHPAHREGLGLAPLEAMYCGLPIIASDTRGIQDYTENGVSGYLCPADDIDGFAKAIKKLKDNAALCERFGTLNKEKMKLFCLDCVKQEVLNIFIDENDA